MRVTPIARLLLGAAATALAITACANSQGEQFWRKDTDYDLIMRVTQRSPSLQARRDSGKLRDTIAVTLRVDSAAGDSIFGSYQADWRPLGVWIGNTPPSPQRFAGEVHGREFVISLSPRVIDAGAGLRGRVDSQSARGTWGVDGGHVQGEFRAMPLITAR